MYLINILKKFRLLEFYIGLQPEEKDFMNHYSRQFYLYTPPCKDIPACEDLLFSVKRPAQLLWTTAANAIPDRKWDFAEKLLVKALEIANDREDLAWTHANLTQLYYDQHRKKPASIRKCLHHCHQLLATGYFTSWAENMLAEVMVMQIQ